MARKKEAPAPPPPPPAPPNRFVGWFIRNRARIVHWGGLALLVLVCGLAGIFGLRRLSAAVRQHVQDLPRYQVETLKIELTERPAWVRAPLVAEVAYAQHLPQRLSILEPGLAKRLSDVFGAHPWVEHVERVELLNPARIRISLAYREPVAVVRTADHERVPVDAAGIVCPPDDFGPADLRNYWIIAGERLVWDPEQTPVGIGWPDRAIQDAAATAKFLAPYRLKLGLTTIDVRSYQGDVGARIRLTSGRSAGWQVVWGKPPGREDANELGADKKLARLLDEVQDHGPFSARNDSRTFDVTRFDAAHSNEPDRTKPVLPD